MSDHTTRGDGTIEWWDTTGAVSLLSMRLGDDVVHWPTRRGGVLDQLRQISERLAHYYGWDQADAALFVITGITPRVQAIRGDVQLKFPLPARSKIVLTIDPTTTPNEVAAAYGSVRRRQFGWLRRPAAKHTALAVFALRHQSMPLRDQMHAWNSGARPVHRYRFLSVFRRDCELALRSLAELRPQRGRQAKS